MTTITNRFLAFGEAVSRFAVWFGGALIVATSLLICAEVLLRKFANISTGGADELSGYALAISTTWSLGFTLLRRSHVRVDVIYSRLGSGLRAWVDCLSILSMTVFAVILTYFCSNVLRDSIALSARSNTTLGIPLWIPQGLWVLGLVLFSLISTMLTVIAVTSLIRRDLPAIQRIVGSKTTDEELAEEFGVGTHDDKDHA